MLDTFFSIGSFVVVALFCPSFVICGRLFFRAFASGGMSGYSTGGLVSTNFVFKKSSKFSSDIFVSSILLKKTNKQMLTIKMNCANDGKDNSTKANKQDDGEDISVW